jgi:predicted membrane protein
MKSSSSLCIETNNTMRSLAVPGNPSPLAQGFPHGHSPSVSTTATTAQTQPLPARAGTGAIACLLAGVSFALHLGLALHLDAVESLDQFDVFFHADTQARLDCTTHGQCDHRSSISHPGLDILVNPPVRGIAALASGLGAWQGETKTARHAITLWVSPAAAALQSAWVFMLFVALGLPRLSAALASALATLSLSGLLFGSIPESFALSSCAIAGGYLLAARSESGNPLAQRSAWLLLAVIATAITVTNLVSIIVLFAAARFSAEDSPQQIVKSSGMLAGSAAIITLVLALASLALYDSRPLTASEGVRYVSKWSEDNQPLERLARFPTALANSVAGIPPNLATNYQGRLNDSKYKFRFTYEDAAGVFSSARPLATLVLVLSLCGGWVMWRGARTLRGLAAASLAILVWNAGLHAFWGVGFFLYSQHWQLAFCLLLLGPLFIPKRFALAASGLIAALTLAVAAQNWMVIRVMLAHFSLPTPP